MEFELQANLMWGGINADQPGIESRASGMKLIQNDAYGWDCMKLGTHSQEALMVAST